MKSRINNCEAFTIGEIGFGTGINFLATTDAWKMRCSKNAKLHYISIEKHPVTIEDLQNFYSHITDSFPLTSELLTNYPLLVSGAHRIDFPENNTVLTLIFSDALDALKQSRFTVDAWFLDGFAPSKNPELWTAEIAKEIYRLTKPNGTFATYTAAGLVRTNFAAAGFHINKQSGFCEKRHMLVGKRTQEFDSRYSIKSKSWFFNNTIKSSNKHALVIGGGFAGTAISAALAKRKWQVEIIERHSTLATEASGNINAILMPRLSIDHDLQAQLTLQGFLYSLRYLNKLQSLTKKRLWHPCGVIQIPRDQKQWQRMLQIISQEQIPENLLHPVSTAEATTLSGCEVTHQGWHFPCAGWAVPGLICTSLFAQHENIDFIGNQEITELKYDGNLWHALNNGRSTVATAEVVILANALSVSTFEQTRWCQLNAKRGQITLIPAEHSAIHPQKVVCADAYITPKFENYTVLGASFVSNDTRTDIRDIEHQENITKICKIISGFPPPSIHEIEGRAAIRAVSPDRLPVVGPVAEVHRFEHDFTSAALGASNTRYPIPEYLRGMYIASGFGSRGMAWIPVCAEALACIINNEPLPFNQNIANAIHPNRFLMKQLLKRVQYGQ